MRAINRVATVLTTGPVLAASLALQASAAHAAIPTCPDQGSTILADFYTLGTSHTRIASYDVSPTEKNICIDVAGPLAIDHYLLLLDRVRLVLVVKSDVAMTPPTVTQTSGTGSCDERVLDMTAPLVLSMSVGASVAPAVCLGVNGTTTTMTFDEGAIVAAPDVDVWTPRDTVLNASVACATYMVPSTIDGWTGLGGPQPTPSFWAYYYCQAEDHQLV